MKKFSDLYSSIYGSNLGELITKDCVLGALETYSVASDTESLDLETERPTTSNSTKSENRFFNFKLQFPNFGNTYKSGSENKDTVNHSSNTDTEHNDNNSDNDNDSNNNDNNSNYDNDNIIDNDNDNNNESEQNNDNISGDENYNNGNNDNNSENEQSNEEGPDEDSDVEMDIASKREYMKIINDVIPVYNGEPSNYQQFANQVSFFERTCLPVGNNDLNIEIRAFCIEAIKTRVAGDLASRLTDEENTIPKILTKIQTNVLKHSPQFHENQLKSFKQREGQSMVDYTTELQSLTEGIKRAYVSENNGVVTPMATNQALRVLKESLTNNSYSEKVCSAMELGTFKTIEEILTKVNDFPTQGRRQSPRPGTSNNTAQMLYINRRNRNYQYQQNFANGRGFKRNFRRGTLDYSSLYKKKRPTTTTAVTTH